MPPDCTITNVFRLDGLDAEVPHLGDYFGLWSILEEPFRAAVGRVNALDLTVHVQQQIDAQSSPRITTAASGVRDYEVTDEGVAIVSITGPMMKHLSSLSDGTSTILARRQIRLAAADEQVRAIILKIDSPGGTVSGTFDLADDVAAAAKQKPLLAYIEDVGASAAYDVAAQANKIFANRSALVGGMGTYGVIYDQSARAAQLGVKVHVLRAGQFKGAGTPGTEITQEQLGEWQRIVDELNEFFIRGVASGRRMALQRVRELADGRVHVGAEAVKLGLIDGVQSLDETINQLFSKIQTNKKVRSQQTMAEQNSTDLAVAPPAETVTKPAAATLQEIQGACAGADNDFLVEQLGTNATLDQARSAWMAEQNRRLEAQQEKLDKQEAAAKKPGFDIPGERASGQQSGDAAYDDPVAEFNSRIRKRVAGGMDRRTATMAVAREDKALHEAFVKATNKSSPKVQGLIEERFAVEA